MKDIKTIIDAYKKHEGKMKMALASVVGIEGSSYRRIGARMMIFENGDWLGGISGGCLEGDVLKNAKRVMENGSTRVVSYDTRDGDPYQIGVGLGCRGKIDICIEALGQSDTERHLDFLKKVLDVRYNTGMSMVISKNTNPWSLRLGQRIYEDHTAPLPETLLKDLNSQIAIGKSKIMDYQSVKILHEIFQPRIHLILLGLHYDVPPLVDQAKTLFWKTSLIANLAKMKLETIQAVDNAIMYNQESLFNTLEIDNRSAVVLMSHDYKTDIKYLKKLLKTDIPYIGILGPKKRFESILIDLDQEQFFLDDKDLNRIYSPIGLDIGAKTPEEIALSIAGEINAFFSDRNGYSLKYREGTIYESY